MEIFTPYHSADDFTNTMGHSVRSLFIEQTCRVAVITTFGSIHVYLTVPGKVSVTVDTLVTNGMIIDELSSFFYWLFPKGLAFIQRMIYLVQGA